MRPPAALRHAIEAAESAWSGDHAANVALLVALRGAAESAIDAEIIAARDAGTPYGKLGYGSAQAGQQRYRAALQRRAEQ